MSKVKSKIPKSTPRNSFALSAKMRKGGPMKHRLEPKQGAKNDQPEFLEDAYLPDGMPMTMDTIIGHRPLCRCDECLKNLCKACGGGGYIRDAMQTFCKPCTCDKGKALALEWSKDEECK